MQPLFSVKLPSRSLLDLVDQYTTDKGRAAVSVRVVGNSDESDRQIVMIDDPRLPYVVTGHVQRSRVVDMRFEARSDAAIAPADLRSLGVIGMLQTWAELAREQTLNPIEKPTQQRARRSYDEAVAEARRTVTADRMQRRLRDVQQQEKRLHEVVDMYKQLVAEGRRNPRQIIAQRLGYSPVTIGALLVEARKPPNPLLPPAPRGRAGIVPKKGRTQV